MSRIVMDANEAVARVAFKTNEVIAIYPITPSSPMGEHSDEYAENGEKNIFGTVPDVMEMQSEGGASGAVHGALQAGALTTTFTASQGLLLMIPNMHKIAGELTPTVFHVAARSLAAQALSIFGDHTDVMQCRPTGFAMLASCDAQEAQDFALIAQAASLEGRLPVLHFFDGFRTSHELMNVETLDDTVLKAMIPTELVNAHKARALDPEAPVLRGTSQNPDVYFQGRESVNRYYDAFPGIVQEQMDRFAALTGRQYRLYEYHGCPNPKKLIVLMTSGAKTVRETVDALNTLGYETGVLIVRLFRPFDAERLLEAIPKSVEAIAVLDRTKEPGAYAEPLSADVMHAYAEAFAQGRCKSMPRMIGGRYGLSSKEFTPAMVKAVFDELKKAEPKPRFTVGITDDVTHLSLDIAPFETPGEGVTQALFYGLGSDGTVGANKNSIKIIGEEGRHVQGYFVYDSKKSGSMTTSHLRFSPEPIQSTYLIDTADFVGVHQFVFILKYDILKQAKPGAKVLINAPYDADEVWTRLPRIAQERIIEKGLKLYTVNAYEVAKGCGLGRRINTIMQTCFFHIAGVIPPEQAIAKIKESIEKTYGKKGEMIVRMNFCGVDKAIENLHEIAVPDAVGSGADLLPVYKLDVADPFLENVTAKLEAFEGDSVPVSAIPADGTWPLGTTKYEKREIALDAPVWDPDVCIQCGKCMEVCPHAVIRAKVFDEALLSDAPEGFSAVKVKSKTFEPNEQFTIKVSVEDCTGCSLCVEMCPAKNKSDLSKKAINMAPIEPIHDAAVAEWDYFLSLPEVDRSRLDRTKVKEAQLLQPLFEFSGACPGCGETPYVKLASQLFGDRMIVANATGCSSIYGGNLPTTPWAKNAQGQGTAWSNSLFEDNAEFGLGMRASIDKQSLFARELLEALRNEVGADLADALIGNAQKTEAEIARQRANVKALEAKLAGIDREEARLLEGVSSYLIRKSVWAMGGDGWAYDIGYGGLDHVLASGRNINILVMDTQVYSNTGGQTSKATPVGAVAKFSAGGKPADAKDLALHALSYGNVYVARVAMGANDAQTLKAFVEAEAYEGVSIIIAYSHCIAHGYDLRYGMQQQKLAVESGLWPLMRYNPEKIGSDENPFSLDYKEPKAPVKSYMYNEARFKMVLKMNAERAEGFLDAATQKAQRDWIRYRDLADSGNLTFSKEIVCK
ncbi:pyruvate:ferredoxin (flavodoxin) oxidoreductase [Sulfurimonas sp. HSL-3221]|uniref:pyruvate:ferredoxin (flavodoxin) oxidoreductase n=1 Tax=Sulfurimonadaceae TaxID=2771471 RepID=UPI001E3621AF|nr:pyruvate:ferredoxin (flavodoxin) oxidoreductase [Sulfurimonas sp. HSL-3221]UFS62066.1 pyruvate:ferredoxin (flavodoxin) oxidoreductase [Sulfurimonas sp. HSL-3221]